MKNLCLIFLLFLTNVALGTTTVPLQKSLIELSDSATAAKANAKEDDYTRALTQFDLQIRLKKGTGVSQADYLALAASEVRNWTKEEKDQLEKAIHEINDFLTAHKIMLQLPTTIQIIKTKGREEFEAEGYTRENRIMLCVKPGQIINTHIVAHELFHVYSRFLGAKKDAIYGIYGFKKCNRINTQEAMQHTMITNPDCPFIEHYIHLEGTGGNPSTDAVLQLYSKTASYEHFSLANDVDLTLLQVAGPDDQKMPVMKDGKGVRLSFEEVPDFFRQISMNTQYILHPEEIAAEHFAMLVINKQVPQPEFQEKLKLLLQQ